VELDNDHSYLIARDPRFSPLADSFDVVRHKKDKVKIIDFGPMDELSVKSTLFTYEELQNHNDETPEFRFIGEEIGIQPKPPTHFCIPREISEFFQSRDNVTLLDIIQRVSFTEGMGMLNLPIQLDIIFNFDAQL